MFAHAHKQAKSMVPPARGVLQRKCDSCHKKKSILKRSTFGSAPEMASSIVHGVQRSSRHSQDPAASAFEEPRFAYDFSKIPVHHRSQASIQAKLTINTLEDIYEQEADRIADQVLAAPAHHVVSGAQPHIQRFSGQLTGQVDAAAPASVERVLATPGRPLEPTLRKDMEQRFGYDFSSVRVHSDSAAEQSVEIVNAKAYTLGHNIVFGAGKFSPGANEGRRLIAHELTHVIQQTGSPPLQTNKLEKKPRASDLCCDQQGSRSALGDGNTVAEFEAKRVAPHGEDIAVIRGINRLQTRLIQRDGPHKAGDVTQEETEALLNFKNDWQNNFSYYDQLIKISGRSYNKDQKEAIKAVKNGNSISITLGKPYFTQNDENIRWQWIKTEVIDKNIKTDRFEDIAYDPTHSKINEINPPYAAGQYCTLNCPATAASLGDYLRTGNVSPAICRHSKEGIPGYGFDISKNTFSKSVSWKQAEATIKKQLKKHGDFVIVEATRSEKQMKDNNLAKNHYFAVVNMKGTLFAMDAFGGGIVNDNIQNYMDTRIKATTYRIVKGEFKVKEVIPKP